MPTPPAGDLLLLAPEILLATAGLLLLLLGAVGRGLDNRESVLLSALSLGLTLFLLLRVRAALPEPKLILQGTVILDGFAFFWKVLILLATALALLLSYRFLEEGGYRAADYYALLLFAAAGMLFMVSGYTLLTIWIGLETLALASYILAGYFKRETRAVEAALKYFVLGALSSGIFLYGVSLLYGATGALQLADLAASLAGAGAERSPLALLGWLLLAAGLFFKVAAAPFHVWTPDVYTGAPTPVAAWLATASKGASFAILTRILYEGLGGLAADWQGVVAAVAAASMIWGTLGALTQDNVKRLLAYSSIAHTGYVLLGVLSLSAAGLGAAGFYLLAYTFLAMGAFGTVILLERREYAGETCADYAGLSRRSPLLAAMMLLFLLGLTGLPPTGGFVGKVYLFAAAVEAGWTWLAVVGVLASAVSLAAYFRIVVFMYLRDSDSGTPAPPPLRAPALAGGIALCAAATLILGVHPSPFVELARRSLGLLPLP